MSNDLPPGIYKDGRAYRAVVAIAAGRTEKRFPLGTSLKEIKRWRNVMKVKLETLHPQKRAGAIGAGTFSADVRRYLKTLVIASWASRRSELRAWERRIGRVRRSRVTADHIKAAIKAWTEAGVPPKTTINRCRALSAMYRTLDGPDAWTPLVGVQRPKVRKRKPLRVPVETLRAVEVALRTGDPQTHARYMVLIATGARPIHLKRAQPEDVDIARRYWNIPAAKDGEPIELWLNDDMIAAWTAFMAADAWGDFNSTDYAKALRAAGWPIGVRPYNAKHTFGQDLADLGISRETIGDWYGHAPGSDSTVIYTGTAKLRRVSEAVEGRLGWGVAQPPPPGRLAPDLGNTAQTDRIALLRKMLEDALASL